MGMDEDEVKKKSGMAEDDDLAHDVDVLDEGSDDLLDEYAEDQEWESYDSEEEDEEEPAPRRKKGLFSFNTIVIVIAVVFGGIFIAMQLSKHAPKQQQVVQRQQVSPTGLQMVGQKERQAFNQIDDPAAVPGLPPEPAAEGARQGAGLSLPTEENMPPMPGIPGFGDEEKAADSSSQGALPEPGIMSPEGEHSAVAETRIDASASPDASSSGVDVPREGSGKVAGDVLTPMPDFSGKDKDRVLPEGSGKEDAVAQEENVLPLPKAGDIFKATDKKGGMPSSPVKKVETQTLDGVFPDTAGPSAAEITGSKDVPESKTVSTVDVSSADVSSLESRLSELGDRLDRLEQKIGKAPEIVQESGEIKDLKETVKRLETRISGLSSAAAAPVAVPASEKKAAPVRKESEKKVRSSSSVASVPKPRVAVTKAVAPSLTAQSVPALEIRAAQPGRAWVARPGDNDLQSVSVGDTLPGIGRVTSIAQVGGRWVVEGTRGRLNQ